MSHWLHFFTFLRCDFLHVSVNLMHKKMHSHLGHIFSFPYCNFSLVSVNCLHNKMQSHSGHIYLIFLHWALWNVSLNHLHKKNKVTVWLFTFVWLFSFVYFQTSLQIASLPDRTYNYTGCICFLQFACFKCTLKLLAMYSAIVPPIQSHWLHFPTVCFHMCPQITYIKGRIVTLIAFFCLFPMVCFQMCLLNCLLEKIHNHTNCICWTFSAEIWVLTVNISIQLTYL